MPQIDFGEGGAVFRLLMADTQILPIKLMGHFELPFFRMNANKIPVVALPPSRENPGYLAKRPTRHQPPTQQTSLV